MDLLNNLNVVISIIVGIFGIGGYIVGIVAYLRHKAASSQDKQTIQLQSSQKQSSYRAVSKSLSKWDWMELLWLGLEDSIRARGGVGIIVAGFIGVFGALFIFTASSFAGSIFLVLFFSFLLLFYVYFVGRRLEKKVEEINRPHTKKSSSIQSH